MKKDEFVEAFKDMRVIIIMCFIFSGFVITFYGINEIGGKIYQNQIELTNKVLNNQKSNVTKETVVNVVHDTILSTVYSNAYPDRLDTFEILKGFAKVEIGFADGTMDMKVTEYKIMCNGDFYMHKLSDGNFHKDCNGEWIFVFKGERE